MDGVITDSEHLYAQAVNLALSGTGEVLTDDDHRQIMGSSIDYTWTWVIDALDLDHDIGYWKSRYDPAVVHLLSEKAPATPGVYELVDALEARDILIGLATSSQENWVRAVLDRLGLAGRFRSVASCDMVENAKPAPDLYLLAAKGLRVPPQECLAIEDTPRGIQSAKSAGMSVVGLKTEALAGADLSQADHITDSLGQFDFAWLD